MNPPPSFFVCGPGSVLLKSRGVREPLYGLRRRAQAQCRGERSGVACQGLAGEEQDCVRRLLVRFGAADGGRFGQYQGSRRVG